jgi:antitoxin VapB
VSLNIKQPRAHELATQLAKMTGESLTTAVVRSLEERIAREEKKHGKGRTAERMMAFVNRYADKITTDLKSTDHGDILYGEDGLPK